MKMVSPVSSPYLRKLSEDTSRSRVKGMAIFIVSVLFNVASVSFNKALFLICTITPMEYSFMISLMCIIPYCIYGAFTKQPVIQFPPSIAKVMLIRCIIGTLNMAILTIGIKLMPVSIYAVISSIAPLFTQVFCYLLLNEKITALDVGGLVASFIGLCLIIVNPNHAANSANHDYSIWALFIPLAQAITLALIFTFTKMIIKQRVHCLAPAISVSAMICIFHSGAGFVSDSMKFSISNYNAKAVLFLAISTASNTIGFALWNLAIKYESPVKLSVLSYLSTVCYFIIDIMIYKISVDTYEIIGSIIIVGCSSSIIIYKAYFNS
jgi:drug/metabolite transporter (DMT)-like permease